MLSLQRKLSSQNRLISSLQEVNDNRQEERQKKIQTAMNRRLKHHSSQRNVKKDIELEKYRMVTQNLRKTLTNFVKVKADKKSELKSAC